MRDRGHIGGCGLEGKVTEIEAILGWGKHSVGLRSDPGFPDDLNGRSELELGGF